MLYYGYLLIPHDNYLAWKSSVNGNGYDADGRYGFQCWDLCAEFWYSVGFPTLYPKTGPNLFAEECWTVSREINASYNGVTYFDLIYNVNDVKQGDVVVFYGTSVFPQGHIGFADEDYNGSGMLTILGQNQGSGGTPPPTFPSAGGSTANVKSLPVSNFAGAFRYREWTHPSYPKKIEKKRKFPWAIFANKFRNRCHL